MTDVWIDTDPSIGVPFHEADDGFALIQAFNSPELRIRGISTTYGNAGLATTTRIAREMAARFGSPAGINDAHVHAGAASARDLGKITTATDALRAALADRVRASMALLAAALSLAFSTVTPTQVAVLMAGAIFGWAFLRADTSGPTITTTEAVLAVPRFGRKGAVICLTLFFALLGGLPVLRDRYESPALAVFDSSIARVLWFSAVGMWSCRFCVPRP